MQFFLKILFQFSKKKEQLSARRQRLESFRNIDLVLTQRVNIMVLNSRERFAPSKGYLFCYDFEKDFRSLCCSCCILHKIFMFDSYVI